MKQLKAGKTIWGNIFKTLDIRQWRTVNSKSQEWIGWVLWLPPICYMERLSKLWHKEETQVELRRLHALRRQSWESTKTKAARVHRAECHTQREVQERTLKIFIRMPPTSIYGWALVSSWVWGNCLKPRKNHLKVFERTIAGLTKLKLVPVSNSPSGKPHNVWSIGDSTKNCFPLKWSKTLFFV